MEQLKKIQQYKERHLKVYPKHFVRLNSSRPIIFPEIRLCGKWLQNIGFKHGQNIKVQPEKNKITITIDKNKQRNK